MPAYLDYAATTPLHPRVREVLFRHFDETYGNASSRTHPYGLGAKRVVEAARRQLATVAAADPSEIIFTSGATEANNLAILGLRAHGLEVGRRHLITTAIEHKAVLEPMEALARDGFELTVVPVGLSGRVEPAALLDQVRPDTLLVSMMQVNNETGIQQPVAEIAAGLADSEVFLHIDAAQGFAKAPGYDDARIDLMAISAHKLRGPKGVGALVARRRRFVSPPLRPLMFGGGHERGLRPGTLPVPLIAGFSEAVCVAIEEHDDRRRRALQWRSGLLNAFTPMGPTLIGDPAWSSPHVIMLAFPNIDSEALMLSLRDLAAVSNGSACTSARYTASPVLTAMGLPAQIVAGAVRFSWGGDGPEPDWPKMAEAIRHLAP